MESTLQIGEVDTKSTKGQLQIFGAVGAKIRQTVDEVRKQYVSTSDVK
jgi:hypothetical protein